MKTLDIKIGTLLNIEYRDIIEGENPIVVKSKVIDCENGNILIIEQPIYKATTLIFKK